MTDPITAAEQREIERLRKAIESIRLKTMDGSICNDVAWYSKIETLHDFCASVLEHDEIRLTLLPDDAEQRGKIAGLEEAAKVIDEKCAWILSRQDGRNDAVDRNIRMVAVTLPELSASLRALAEKERGS